MKNLNYKLRVTPEQSEAVQKALFENGCRWVPGSKEVGLTEEPYLVVENNEISFIDSEQREDFYEYPLPEITPDELLELLNAKTKTKPKRRKHADLIIAWANDNSLEIEVLENGLWVKVSNPSWFESEKYRIKPKTISINGVEVPKPENTAPEYGCKYYVPSLKYYDNVYSCTWLGDSIDKRALIKGMVHLTKEAAMQHAKALILASGGRLDE